MSKCVCSFTRNEDKNCDGTHKVVKAVKENIKKKIEAIEIETSITNAVGMKFLAIKAVDEN